MICAKYKSLSQTGAKLSVFYDDIPKDYFDRITEEYSNMPSESMVCSSFKNELNSENLKNFVESHYLSYTFSLQETAAYFGVHASYLSQYFSACIGEAFIDYVTRERIDKAKELLSTTNYSIGKISEMVGYINQTSFIRRFKQICSVTPGDYRNKCKTAVEKDSAPD